MSLLSALCLALLVVGSYGQLGNNPSQYSQYSVPLQGGGYAGYIRPNYQYGGNYNQLRPDLGYGYGLNQQQQQYGLSSQSYLPYSYVLNLQSDRGVAGSQSQISTPLADMREQQIQPQLVSPRYLARAPAYSTDSNVQPLGATPNTLLLIPVSDNLNGYNYGGGISNLNYGGGISNLNYGGGISNPNYGGGINNLNGYSLVNPYGNPGYGYGYGYRPIGTQSSASNVVKREESAQSEEESARSEATDNNAKTE